MLLGALTGVIGSTSVVGTGHAATGSATTPSPLAGNGHNVSFDGRVFIVRRGAGWELMVLRPERVTYGPGGLPRVDTGAFSDGALIQEDVNGENALAICEEDAADTPYPCDEAGNRAAGGPYACYDLVIVDSNALGGQYNGLRQRDLRIWIASPSTSDAQFHKHEWRTGYAPMRVGGTDLRGIEPTVSRDGRLLVWQGHPDNDGAIDILMYATNDTPCAAGGWDGPHVISHMYRDPRVMGRYRLGERQLRAADGTPYADGALVRGAYPWLFPEGDAVTFTAANMPCRGTENPPGCGPRRNALSVMGYPTNWGLAHIDGDVNPSTTDTVRLFFSSPGPVFDTLPVTGGTDVWPFFGSNTSNYTELVFDDALDGQYAAVLHMNESVDVSGNLDRTRTPDTSGYFNTGTVQGGVFPEANNGLFGKAIVLGGDGDHVVLPHDASLDPVNAITVEMWIRPTAPVDCDAANNYRLLLGKGNIGDGSYSIVLEEGERFQARVRAGGVQRAVASDRGIPVGEWSHVGFTYDAATGAMAFFVNGERAGTASHPPATLSGSTHPLRIGGPGGARAVCPTSDGAFQGEIDEVRVSRSVRDLTFAPRPGNHARFVSQLVPPEVEAGRPFTVRVAFRNVGTTAWAPATGHRLGAQMPMDNDTWGTGRLSLPRRISPSETITVEATLTAPATLGSHAMQWRMVHEGAEWFGDVSAPLTITVVEPGTLPDAGPLPPLDAGVALDAGPSQEDAGPPLAVDAGPPIRVRDAGRPSVDASVRPIDAGVRPGDAGAEVVDGGCSATPSRGFATLWLAALVLGLALRRRRR